MKRTRDKEHRTPRRSAPARPDADRMARRGAAEPSLESRRNRAAARSQGGLPTRRSSGALQEAWGRAVRILTSPEELILLILFVAFVGFAVDWFLRILG
ncbi:MAG: hypothetical protein RQ751_03885 [Longimicrobiales bacterium]|nr:hypothetical protein [Longimicrobiales bacterium]